MTSDLTIPILLTLAFAAVGLALQCWVWVRDEPQRCDWCAAPLAPEESGVGVCLECSLREPWRDRP